MVPLLIYKGKFLKVTDRNSNRGLMLWPRLSVVFRRLVRLGSFPPYWRQVNVTPVPKGPPSSSAANYRPISITSVLSKVFDRKVSVCLGRFMELNVVLPTHPVRLSERSGYL